MARIVLPEPRALAFRYQRQHQDVQPTVGMNNYRPQDIGATLALAERVRDEYALPAAQAVYKRAVGDPMMEAARRRAGLQGRSEPDFEAPADLGPLAMAAAPREDVEGAVGEALRSDFAAATMPAFVRRNLPIIARVPQPLLAPQPEPTPQPQPSPTPEAQPPVPFNQPAAFDRPQALGGVAVRGGSAPIAVPGVQRQRLSDRALAMASGAQEAPATQEAELPSYGLDFDEGAVYNQDELQSLALSAKMSGTPEDKARVAALIDRQPMHDAVPQSFAEFFSGAHIQRRRNELKAELGMTAGSGGGVSDPLKVAEFRRKEADSAARRPGWIADSQRKGEVAAFARTREEQEAFERDLKNDLAQYAVLRAQYGAASAQAKAVASAIRSKYQGALDQSTIARNFGAAGLDRERAATERVVRDPRVASIKAGTENVAARTVTEGFRPANVQAQTGMFGRMPAQTGMERSAFSTEMDLDERIAKLRGEVAGDEAWLTQNPEYTGSGPNVQGMIRRANVSGSAPNAQRELTEIEQKRPAVRADLARKKREIEELLRLKGELGATATRYSTSRSRPVLSEPQDGER